MAWRLLTRDHLVSLSPHCKLPPLSQNELIFHCVTRFYQNIYINGWDGYLYNTDNEFGDFLPVALAAVGAHEFSQLAYEALQWEEYLDSLAPDAAPERSERRSNSDAFFECREDLADLLYQFWNARRSEFPSAEPVTNEEANAYELERECLNNPDLRNRPRFVCPKCNRTYISKKDDGECPRCAVHRMMDGIRAKMGLPQRGDDPAN